jgi:hypothetical protein
VATVKRELHPEEAQYLASAFPRLDKPNGTNFPVSGLYYDTTTAQSAFWKVAALNYGSGDLTVTVYWYADTATANGVVWEAAIAAITPNADSTNVETKAFATAASAADTHLGTTGQRVHSIAITVTAVDNLSADDVFWLRIGRLPANASDNMAGFAVLLMAVLSYSDT